MTITRIITDIPADRVNFVLSLIRADGGTSQQQPEVDGEVTVIATYKRADSPPVLQPPADSPAVGWMNIAKEELDQAEVPGAGNNPRILQYHATTQGHLATADSVPWCSSFVNYCIARAGLTGTNSKAARSWLNWGVQAPDFVPGCIVVLKRENSPKGHVGFFVGTEAGRIQLLGGNQGDKVSVASFDPDRVIGRRLAAS